MIDLTPLDVRKKAGDFKRGMRGYEPQEVNDFLQLVAERMEELVKENLTLRERSDRLLQQVAAHEAREKAVQEALVMAQKLREEVRAQAEREAELAKQSAEVDIERRIREAGRKIEAAEQRLADLERRRLRFLKAFRTMLERELESLDVEEALPPDAPVAGKPEEGERRPGGVAPSLDPDVPPAPLSVEAIWRAAAGPLDRGAPRQERFPGVGRGDTGGEGFSGG